jgi:membrane peptidoglycan carboxypeptidase
MRPVRTPAARPIPGCAPAAIFRKVLYPVAVTWMRKRDHNIFANAASLLICGILAGIVVAAAAFPAAAIAGLASKAGSDDFANLPSVLGVPTPPQISYVYASDGKTLLSTFYDENRHDITLADMPLIIRNAIIAAEDQRFYQHHGVDLQGVVRAFLSNNAGNDTQGASTLTQQYVRQAITYSASSPAEVIAATEQTPTRKLREAKLALQLEKEITKDQILQNYLNIAAFGHGAYGIYAASQVYFNKEPKDLTLAEAALLAGLPKAPSELDPVTEPGRKASLERRSYVLRQMVKLGMITQAEADDADKTEIKITGTRTPNGCTNTISPDWGFFCDFFYRWWIAQPAFGADEAERAARLKSKGYRIVTTLDVNVQASAKRNVEAQVPTGKPDALMLAAIEPGTGRVKAMAANRIYGLDTSNNPISTDPAKKAKGIKGTYPVTTNPIISGGGDISGYKAGSTFKIFTMLTALEKGYTLDFTQVARSPYQSPIYIAAKEDAGACPDHIHYCPVNASPSMNGPRNMWSGYGLSVNTYFIPLQEKVGADNVIAMSKRLGIHYRNPRDIFNTTDPTASYLFGPFTIGVTDTVPLELANAYATVAAEGKYCEPIPAMEISDMKGNKIPDVTTPRCTQAVSPDVANAAADVARCPIYDRGGLGKCVGGTTGSYFTTASGSPGATVAQSVGHPIIGKTGTSDNNWTANLVIATKQLAIASTGADPDFAQQPHNNDFVQRVNKSAVQTMKEAVADLPKIDFARPPNSLVFGKTVAIADYTCKSPTDAVAGLNAAGFVPQVESAPIDSPCPAGTVAKTDPAGNGSKGTSVSIFISNGNGAKPPVPGPGTGGAVGGGGGPGHG